MAGTALKYDRVTEATTWKKVRQSFTQRTVNQSRKRAALRPTRSRRRSRVRDDAQQPAEQHRAWIR